MTKLYGLIGRTLKHSFSQNFFREKFKKEGIADSDYLLYELDNIIEFPALLEKQPDLRGLNVTIPYKLEVMRFIDHLDSRSKEIGAVNTIKISKGQTTGYNTDYLGFKLSLQNWLSPPFNQYKALVLGTGGASKAVIAALNDLQIPYKYVSRQATQQSMSYQDLQNTKGMLDSYRLIINTTPLGMSPNIHDAPTIPYDQITTSHYFYDLVYNPAETLFLKYGKDRGAKTKNGLEMLELQAEKAWEIWNS